MGVTWDVRDPIRSAKIAQLQGKSCALNLNEYYPVLTRIEVQALGVHQVLQNVALLLEVLRLPQHGNQLLHLCVRKVGFRAMALDENFWHGYYRICNPIGG